MKTLSVVGTAAMFLVGGGILVHGVPALHHAVTGWVEGLPGVAGVVAEQSINAGVGIVAGALLFGAFRLFQRMRARAG